MNAWESLLGELGEEGKAIRQREERERVVAEETARKAVAEEETAREREHASKMAQEQVVAEVATTNLAIIAAALDSESTDSKDELPLTHRCNIQQTGVTIQEPSERPAAGQSKKRKGAPTASKGKGKEKVGEDKGKFQEERGSAARSRRR